MPDTIQSYVDAMSAEIRWKKACPALVQEITTHLLEQRDAYMRSGMGLEEAERETLRQMGDPVSLGAELDRVHRPRPQRGLLLLAAALLTAGCVLRLVLSVPADGYLLNRVRMLKDLTCIFLGLCALAGGYLLDVSLLGRHRGTLCLSWIAATALALLFTKRGLFAQNLLPLYPVTLAAVLWSQRGRRWRGVLLCLLWAGAGILLACMIPSSFDVLVVILSAVLLGLLFTRRDWFGVGKGLGSVLVLLPGAAAAALWVVVRWRSLSFALFPEKDLLYAGYSAAMTRQALAAAQWIGPADVAQWEASTHLSLYQLVPLMDTSMLPLNLICRWGWLPFLALLTGFSAFFVWALWKVLRLRQTLGRAVSVAVLTALLAQLVMSLTMNMGVPMTGASFPLLVGNWNTLADMFLIGLMLSAFRDGSLPEADQLVKRTAPGGAAL